jgi:hypothetical protein
MGEGKKVLSEAVGTTKGVPRATGVVPTPNSVVVPMGMKQRWSARRKGEVVLRLLRGESAEVLSRELGVEIYRLEKWRERALRGIETALKEREGDPLKQEYDAALKRIGELSMEVELLRARFEKQYPFGKGRSRR